MHSFVQVCGESGVGKTQLALSVALHSVLPRDLGGLGASEFIVFLLVRYC